MTTIRFPRHQILPISGFESLGYCCVCNAAEGEIPTDCPGEEMTLEQRWAVLEGDLDYLWKEGWTKETRIMRLRRKIMCEEGVS